MKKFTLYYMLLVALVFNLAACGDKDKDDAPAPSKLALLTAKTWKVNKAKVNGMDETQEPLIAFLQLLEYKFNTDKNYTESFLGTAEPGKWEFASNETIIVLDPGTDDEERWTIVELKENSLKVNYTDPADNSKTEYELVPKP